MYIAQNKRKENIAEYILYLWQLEDMLRAMQFSPEAIYSTLIKSRDVGREQQQELLEWYMDIARLLRSEGKEEHGHLEHTMHLIADLNNLHLQLLKLPVGRAYRELYMRAAPELEGLRKKLGKDEVTDIELCFRALYSVVLHRIKGQEQAKRGYIDDVLEVISPLVAQLAFTFRQVEQGEIDLFGGK